MVVVKNEYVLLCLGTPKSVVSQEWIDEMSWFFTCWYKFRKAKSYFNNSRMGMLKNWARHCRSWNSEIKVVSNDLLNWADRLNDICMLIADLNGNGVWSHSLAPAHAILKTHVKYFDQRNHCMVCFSNCTWFIHFLHS